MHEYCDLVSPGAAAEGATGVTYAAGISAASVGAGALCLQLATLPPGARSKAHQHDDHESAAYVTEGTMVLLHGPRLDRRSVAAAGDFLYIPPGVPHVVLNPSETETAVAVLARTDPHEQEEITERPDLEALGRAS
jgi:uncharacterized RmlC-like cupin family protein